MTRSHSGLVEIVVWIVASRPQRVSRYIIRDSSTQRIPAGATASKVNAAKDSRIGDFGYRVGKTRIGTSTWTYLGGDAEGGVLSKGGGQDEGGGTTVGGMRRRILGMRRSAGQRVQQWLPIGVGVSRCGTRSDRGDWPPENVAVLAIPACHYCVAESYIEDSKQMRILGQTEPARRRKLRC